MLTDRRLRAILLAASLPACVLAGSANAWAAPTPTLGAAAAASAEPAIVSSPVTVDGPEREAAPQRVLVRFRAGTDADERRAAREAADAEFVEPLPVSGLQLVDPEPGVTVGETVAELERSPDVRYAEPDAIRTAAATPNDDFFDLQWGLHNTGQRIGGPNGTTGTADADIDAPEAWELETGDASVLVGVLDTGVEVTHPDLAPNIRTNPGETAGNGIDDDGNGYVDDVNGWDWAGDDPDAPDEPVHEDNDPADPDGHGTHVAGTIGARGNDSTGVAGVAWDAGIVPLRVLGEDGSGSVSDLIKGYAYAEDNDIPIVNASLGGPQGSPAERDALAAAPSVLFVVAAGNDAANNDVTGSFPCNYTLANVICVAASDQSDALATFSNYGRTAVDLAAPGTRIASTYPDFQGDSVPDWVYLGGTSMATPHVAGVAALVWSLRPTSTVAQVRQSLLGSVDVKASLTGCIATGGRLNAERALTGAAQIPAPPPPATSCAARTPAASTPTPTPAPVASPTPSPAPAPTTAPAEPAEVATSHRPSSLSVQSGRLVRARGALARLFADDGRRVELAAGRSRSTFVADLTSDVKITAAQRSGLDRLDLAYDGSASRRGTTVGVRVYDWTTRRWRTVATLRNATRDRTVRWSVTQGASRYVSPRGVVRMSIRGTATKAFRTRSDLLRLTTR